MNQVTREDALALLKEYTQSESLLKHAAAVERCMLWYANYYGCSEEETVLWGATGLLHDFDYEQFPEPHAPDGHPYRGSQILAQLGYPDELREAILGHALYTGVPRRTRMAQVLFAVDELSGLITAAALVRPDRSISQLEVRSVMRKFKDKAFARGCNRDDIRLGAEELGIPLETHVSNCIEALRDFSLTEG